MNRLRPLTLGIAVALTAGCAVKRDRYELPTLPLPAQFKRAVPQSVPAQPEAKQASQADTKPQPLSESQMPQWWRMLASAELDALIDRTLANNADLRIATLRVAQAQARSEQAFADELPVLSVPYQAKGEAPERGIGTVGPGGDIKTRHTYQLSLRGDWRVDLWGERRSATESAELQLWRATFQRDDTRRALVANTVSLYIEYLSLNDRLRVARETEEVLQGMVDSVKDRMEAGDATAIDLEQQRAAVEAVRATIPALELQRETLAHALAQLAGVVPESLALDDKGLDSLAFPRVLPGVPASLLLRRPDVRVVEARLLAADADIDVARARLLPPLDLTAQTGYGSYVFSRLFESYSHFWLAIANLSATIFDYGKRSNEVKFARALHEELVETYARTLYAAIREAEDAIATVQRNGRRLEAQQAATDASRRAWDLSMEAYGAGAIDYLTLLDTERTYHRNLDELHRIRMERFKGMAALFAALGGGVPQGGALPGQDEREGTVRAALREPAEAGIRWDGPVPAHDEEEYWLVELAGMQDRAGVAHAWRDLNRRFPQLMAGRVLLPRLQGRVANEQRERTAWYRLFVAHFPAQRAAEEFCADLTAQLQRCRVVSTRSEAFLEFLPEPQREEAPAEAAPAAIPPDTPAPPPAPAPAAGAAARAPGDETPAAPAPEAPLAAGMPVTPVPVPPAQHPPQEEAATAKAADEPAPPPSLGYAVQLETLPERADAEAAAAAWARKGYDTYVYPVRSPQGRIRYTVRTGIWATQDEAAREAKAVRVRKKIYAVPVPVGLDGAGQPTPSVP